MPSIPLTVIKDYPTHPSYLAALSQRITAMLDAWEPQHRKDVILLFSAHGLPESYIEKGDPYLDQVNATMKTVMELVGAYAHQLAFQSRTGPVKWLEPATVDVLKTLAMDGVKDVLLIPISFVSDHIETLYEIDILFKGEARELGIERFRRMESFNLMPEFISALADIALQERYL